jgi:hypothetical protein
VVEDIGVVRERQEAVAEPFRCEQRPAIVGAELDPDPLTLGHGSFPNEGSPNII